MSLSSQHRLRTLAAAGALTLLAGMPAPRPALAQGFPPRPAGAACATGLARAQALPPTASADSIRRRLYPLQGCRPELGPAVAATMTAMRGTRDTTLAYAAFEFGRYFRDPAIARAAAAIARDPGASDLARSMSLSLLYAYLSGRNGTLEQFAAHRRGVGSCTISIPEDQIPLDDLTPSPPSLPEEARAAAQAVQADPGATPALLGASYCVLDAWRQLRGRPRNAHWTFSPELFTVEHVCGTRFRLRNTHPVAIALEWRVGTGPLRRIVIQPPARDPHPLEGLFDAEAPGDLTFYLDGEPFAKASPTEEHCS